MAKKKQVVSFLRTYRFQATEKDPIIDMVHGLMEKSGHTISMVHDRSGISSTTLYNWFDGPTRKPQWASVNAVLRAIGYRVALVKTQFGNGIIEATEPDVM